jgi:hypothetical protein
LIVLDKKTAEILYFYWTLLWREATWPQPYSPIYLSAQDFILYQNLLNWLLALSKWLLENYSIIQ